MQDILISIITINYNNRFGIEKTINSIINQSYSNFEYIVVDGNSTDGSIDVIKKNQLAISKVIIEKDNGIYDAMNKGIKASAGKYLLFINSGDWLTSNNTINELSSFIDENTDIIYGDLIFLDASKNTLHKSNYPENLSFHYFTKRTLPHQATLIKRSTFDLIGLYDTNYKIVSDWGFFCLAICKYQVSYKKIPLYISYFPTDGIGSISTQERIIERVKFLDKHFKLFIDDYKSYDRLRNSPAIRIINKFIK